MTRCTFPHLSFRMQKYFYYCEISRVTATSATEPTGVLEGSGGIQGETASNLDDLLTKQGIGTL